MPTKTIRIDLQVEADNGQDANLRLAVDGTVIYDQAVPATGIIELDSDTNLESLTFELDTIASPVQGAVQTRTFTVTPTGGSIKIKRIYDNFAASQVLQDDVWNFVPGSATDFQICDIVSQPTWDGEALIARYDQAFDEAEGKTPGEILILKDETAVFDVAIHAFNDGP